MAKYYGMLGFYFDNKEIRPGIWDKIIDERPIYGDFLRNVKHTENSGEFNDNIKVNNQISFIADPYAMENFQHIKYATYLGCKWTVTSVEIEDFPRLILNLGGIYNDKEQTCNS